LMPLLLSGLWCSLAVLALNYQLAPEAERMKEEKEARRKAGTDTARDTAVFNVLYRNREARRTWCLHRVPYNLSAENPIREIAVWQQNPQGDVMECWFARSGRWTVATGEWELSDVVHYTLADAATGEILRTPRRVEMAVSSHREWPESPAAVLSDKLDPEFLGVPGLLSALKSRATLPDKAIAGYETTLHWRFALPFRCFLIVLLAAPLGIVASRRNVLGGVTAAIGIFIALRFLSTIVLKAGEGLYLPPATAAWSINVVFAIAGVAMLMHRSRNRPVTLNFLRWIRRV
jgi:lipopolysaccharide export system permease protein